MCPQLAAIISPRFADSCPIMDSNFTAVFVLEGATTAISLSLRTFHFSKYSIPSNRLSTGIISMSGIRKTSGIFSRGIITLCMPCFFADTINGSAPTSGRSLPSSASSQSMSVDFNLSCTSWLKSSFMVSPRAMARSKWLPVFLMCAGAKLMVIRRNG